MMKGEQIRLRGMWTEFGEACPHYRGARDGPGRCIENENRSCQYELGRTCEEWQAILQEWHEEKRYLCQTCFKLRPGDERVSRGQPCLVCAGDYWLGAGTT